MAMLVITRWYIPLNPIKPPFSYGFPMVFHEPQQEVPWQRDADATPSSRRSAKREIPGTFAEKGTPMGQPKKVHMVYYGPIEWS